MLQKYTESQYRDPATFEIGFQSLPISKSAISKFNFNELCPQSLSLFDIFYCLRFLGHSPNFPHCHNAVCSPLEADMEPLEAGIGISCVSSQIAAGFSG